MFAIFVFLLSIHVTTFFKAKRSELFDASVWQTYQTKYDWK